MTSPRSSITYRSARRNQVLRVDGGVWGTASHYKAPVLAKYAPTEPNGDREVARRLAKMAPWIEIYRGVEAAA